MAEAEPDNSEPLKYKTWVLKVSIHCEGCKRKVKRILHSVEGVYTIDVDTKQHKVVVTGNVDENTLIRKLEKSGKHAELWPDFYQKNSKKNDEQFHQDQQPQQQQQQQQQQQPNQNQNQNQNQNTNIEKPKVAFRVEEQPQKVAENSGQQPPPQGKEVRFEGNIPATGESQNPPPNAGGNPGGGGGAKKKKKKKKGHGGNNSNNNNNGNGGNGEVASMEHGGNGGQLSSESHSHPPPPPQNPNMGPGPGLGPEPNPALDSCPEYMSQPQYTSRNRVYEYPPAYYAAAPVYGVSYNTAYPSSSYSASYYSAPAPYSYAYVHHGGEVEAPGPLDWNTSAVQPSDSFEMFSDENPNACSVM